MRIVWNIEMFHFCLPAWSKLEIRKAKQVLTKFPFPIFHWVRFSKIQNWGYFFYLSDNLVEGNSKQWWSRPWRSSPTSFPRRSPLVSAALGPFHFSISFVTTERRALLLVLTDFWVTRDGYYGLILLDLSPVYKMRLHWARFTRNDLVILKLAKSLQSWSGYPSGLAVGCSWTELAPLYIY